MNNIDEKVKATLEKMNPQSRAFLKSIAGDRVQNKMYAAQLKELKEAYDELWKIVTVVLHAQPEKTLRIHETQFLRFKHEYRIDKRFDDMTRDIVLKLLTIHDTLPSKKH